MLNSADTLRSNTVQYGVESRVTVNQRLLVDKMLARYSSDFVVFRELIQNSDDARATFVEIYFNCDILDGSTSNVSSVSQEYPRNLQVKQQLNANYTDSVVPHKASSMSFSQTIKDSDAQFHNSLIREIRTVNDGSVFNEADWKRVASIAEGNVNADSIGQFGVGFFSVFSFSEEPIIVSGAECMVFTWRDDDSLTTYRRKLPDTEQSHHTSVILKMRSRFILHAYDVKLARESNTTTSIVPSINLAHLKSYLIKGK